MVLSNVELADVYKRASGLISNGWTRSFCAINRINLMVYMKDQLHNIPDLENTSFCAYGALVYALSEKQVYNDYGDDNDETINMLLSPLVNYLKDNADLDVTENTRVVPIIIRWNDAELTTKKHVLDSLVHVIKNLQINAQEN